MPLLEIRGLKKRFGGVVALDGVDVDIDDGDILGIIGPNGSGKTTLFNVVAGVHKPTAGRVVWRGRDITGLATHQIARAGIARTFQQAMAFTGLSVGENVRIAFEHGAGDHQSGGSRWKSYEEILDFLELSEVAPELAGTLPFGHLRRLGIAIALAIKPHLLLLDEPAAGLNDGETTELAGIIQRLPGEGIGVCVVDHDMNLIAALCKRLAVLDFGTKIADGPADAVLRDPKVLEVYLGDAA